MDNRTFLNRIAKKSETPVKTVAEHAEALVGLVTELLAACDTVAIPGFGTFTATKTDEHVVTAPDGRRTLLPPSIDVNFQPGSRLRKAASPKV